MNITKSLLVSCFLLSTNNVYADWVEPGGLHNVSRKSFTRPVDMRVSDYDDPDEVQRAWDKAIVWVPTGTNRSKKSSVKKVLKELGNSDRKFPTAIYMHGCTGLWSGSSLRMKFLADNGFLVFGPASLARKKYPQSCDHTTHTGGMFRPTLDIRQADAAFAIETAKSFSFVDDKNMLLIGLSEGGITTATFEPENEKQTVSARVIEGWTCNAGWGEYAGVNAAKNEPVLSLVGIKDPWFQNEWNRGHCGTFMDEANGSKSIVYSEGKLAKRHELIEFKSVQNEVMAFIKQHIDLPLNTRDVQQILTTLGFDPGPIDGAWGSKTLNALNELRSQHGLEAVSKLDQSSVDLLRKLKDT